MADRAPPALADPLPPALADRPFRQLALLLGLKARCIHNAIDQAIARSPLRSFLIALTIGFTCVSMFLFFRAVFWQIYATPLENLITQQFIFGFFFLALLAMLTLSNAVISYGGLFGKDEPPYLLTTPLHPLAVVGVKYLESLALSSWALLLLGLPLMAAYGQVYDQPPIFYPMFVLYFLAFTLLPAALGTAAAFLVANYLRRTFKWVLVAAGVVAAVGIAWWAIGVWRSARQDTDQFLGRLYDELGPIRTSLLPSSWMSSGLAAAANGRLDEAWRYLFILLANGLFISWLCLLGVASRLHAAYDRNLAGGGRRRRIRFGLSAPLSRLLFWYLPQQAQAIALKDLRTFLRYPSQWSQLLIFFGLLLLYILNIRSLPLDLSINKYSHLLGFLNLASMTLIIATFASRFVYPLASLESGQMWLLGVAPVSRRVLLWTKWAFCTLITSAVVVPLAVISSRIVNLGWEWMLIQLGFVLLQAGGLSALAMGLGARFAQANQRNTARIASGFGGTLNLVISMIFVVGMLLSYALAASSPFRHANAQLGPLLFGLAGGLALGLTTILGAMGYGIRHFERREF